MLCIGCISCSSPVLFNLACCNKFTPWHLLTPLPLAFPPSYFFLHLSTLLFACHFCVLSVNVTQLSLCIRNVGFMLPIWVWICIYLCRLYVYVCVCVAVAGQLLVVHSALCVARCTLHVAQRRRHLLNLQRAWLGNSHTPLEAAAASMHEIVAWAKWSYLQPSK